MTQIPEAKKMQHRFIAVSVTFVLPFIWGKKIIMKIVNFKKLNKKRKHTCKQKERKKKKIEKC